MKKITNLKRILTTLLTVVLLGSGLLTGCGAKGLYSYVFTVESPDGEGVEGVTVQICTDTSCMTMETDKKGKVYFDPGSDSSQSYDVHILKWPDEYYYDKETIYHTATYPEDVTFTLKWADETDADTAEAAENDAAASGDDPADQTSGSDFLPDALCSVSPSSLKVEFSGTDMNGNACDSSIFADYDVTLINIWEPWCGPCKNEMPDFEKVYEEAAAAGISFNIIGFYYTDEDAADVISELGITYTIIKNEDYWFDEMQTGYIPVNFLVNSEGYVLPITADEMDQIYKKIYNDDEAECDPDYIYENGQTLSLPEGALAYLVADRLSAGNDQFASALMK